jgi:hypothetical protein
MNKLQFVSKKKRKKFVFFVLIKLICCFSCLWSSSVDFLFLLCHIYYYNFVLEKTLGFHRWRQKKLIFPSIVCAHCSKIMRQRPSFNFGVNFDEQSDFSLATELYETFPARTEIKNRRILRRLGHCIRQFDFFSFFLIVTVKLGYNELYGTINICSL